MKRMIIISTVLALIVSSCSLEEPVRVGETDAEPVYVSYPSVTVNLTGLQIDEFEHSETHQFEGSDEITAEGLEGVLANDQHIIDEEAVSAVESETGLTFPNFTTLFINETANSKQTVGITINVGAATNEIFSFKGSSVAHGITTVAETDTGGWIQLNSAVGGLRLAGADHDTNGPSLLMLAFGEYSDTGKSATDNGYISFQAYKQNGTGTQSLAANENIAVWRNANSSVFIVDAEGDGWFSGNLTAGSYADNTPFYEGDSVAELLKIKGKNGEIDHSTLPEFVRITNIKTVTSNVTGLDSIIVTERRDLGATISMLVDAIIQLNERIEYLEGK